MYPSPSLRIRLDPDCRWTMEKVCLAKYPDVASKTKMRLDQDCLPAMYPIPELPSVPDNKNWNKRQHNLGWCTTPLSLGKFKVEMKAITGSKLHWSTLDTGWSRDLSLSLCPTSSPETFFPQFRTEATLAYFGLWVMYTLHPSGICFLLILQLKLHWPTLYKFWQTNMSLGWSKQNKTYVSQLLVNRSQNLQNRASFFQDSRNEYNKSYVMIKTEQKIKFLSRFSMYMRNITPCGPFNTVITQKLKYTCGWLGFHNDLSQFNSGGVLPRWHKPFGLLGMT